MSLPNAKSDLWAQLAAPVSPSAIAWRQDDRAVQRDGKYFARFVCYIEANTVRERLDAVVPGEWDLTIELLPQLAHEDQDTALCSFKARLTILGVIREGVGSGRDYKAAATDAFKRAAVQFGIGSELYDYDQNWVQVDGDGKFAKPLEDPGEAYARRQARKQGGGDAQTATVRTNAATTPAAPARVSPSAASPTGESTSAPVAYPPGDSIDDRAPLDSEPTTEADEPSCPKCGGKMWDNRLSKRNPKAPDFKCRSRSCDGVIWPAKQTGGQKAAKLALVDHDELANAGGRPSALVDADDDLPF